MLFVLNVDSLQVFPPFMSRFFIFCSQVNLARPLYLVNKWDHAPNTAACILSCVTCESDHSFLYLLFLGTLATIVQAISEKNI
jgi:hypothetical protein